MGLKRSRLLLSYALRPGILPLITLFGIRFGTMLSGALLTEIVFSYPGLGYILYQAILSKDFPLLQALFYMISIMVIATSLALDTIYAVLDPRIRRAALDKG
jgi:peptide/nickel transport system permease protein